MMVEIDGSMGEGGGQILRTSLALAAITGRTVRVYNIRAKRPRPGLQRQHLVSVKAVAELASARVEGLRLGSTEIVFRPGRLRGGRFRFDIGTAGSVTLVLQAVLPVAAFAPEPVEIEVRGGTDVPWSPPVDYVRHVLTRLLERFGYNVDIVVRRRGHYPRGGGIVVAGVREPPGRLKPVNLRERGELLYVEGISHAVRLPRHVAERQARAAKQVLERLGVPVSIDVEWYEPGRDPHLGPGSGIVVWAVARNSVLGGDSLGARGKPAERVGREAAMKLLEDLETGMALDRHASDMLLTYAAVACGESVLGGSRLTSHAETNMYVIGKVVPEARIDFIKRAGRDRPFVVRVKGACIEGWGRR